jgi:hypothetical protein
MSGTWDTQNKVLPGAYLNFKTNVPLSITPGDRGIVALLQEMSVGTLGQIYTITSVDESAYPASVTAADKLLVNEALKNAKAVMVYNLGTAHVAAAITAALVALKTKIFNTIAYPYDGTTYATMKTAIVTWVKAMRDDEGIKIQAVLANQVGDAECIINVAQGVTMADASTMTAAQCTAWVAGATAGAGINQSNTGKAYSGAIDVSPRMTRSEMEAAIAAGKFIFKVDSAQNVTVVYDINCLTTTSTTKSAVFKKNRVIRTLDGISNDITNIFEGSFIGKTNNNVDGRALLRGTLIDYFKVLQSMAAIENFAADDVTINSGMASDAVVIDCYIQPVDSIEKIYITVNLS